MHSAWSLFSFSNLSQLTEKPDDDRVVGGAKQNFVKAFAEGAFVGYCIALAKPVTNYVFCS